jgi:hypothetical protein
MSHLDRDAESIASARPSAPTLVVHRLELTPEAKRQSAALADRFGMTQVATLSRLVEWFTHRPHGEQASVLGQDGSSPTDASRAFLEEVAARPVPAAR